MTMQDRFKFRVWVKDSEEYIEDEAGECHIMYNGELICGDWVDDGYCGHYDYFNDDEVIVEQCTGLKDKNGKLIYEGDIVRTSYPYAVKNYEVKWGDCCWELRKENGFIVLYEKISEALEVIGNIHENPDLLESKDE